MTEEFLPLNKIITALQRQIKETDFIVPSFVRVGTKYCPCCGTNPDNKHYAHCALNALLNGDYI